MQGITKATVHALGHRLMALVAAVLFVGASVAVGASAASAAGTSTNQTPTIEPTFLLAIGASVSVGVQPTARHALGQPTHRGYANDLVAMQAAKGTRLQLVQTGCPGESTSQVLFGGDHCYAPGDSQLQRAVAFLHSHQSQEGVVTLDLGFNDLHGCLFHEVVDMNCVTQRMSLLSVQLPQIITALKAAAGPQVKFVGINHYNPYLAAALHGPDGKAFADASVAAINLLNSTLATVYSQNFIPIADVASQFNTLDTTAVNVSDLGTVPKNLAQICALTWMCHAPPYGPNLHPNDKGYQIIADAIAAVLPS